MSAWLVVYVLAGVGAIALIVGAIARDYLGLLAWIGPLAPERSPRPWIAAGLAALVGLFLTAAVLR